MSKTIATTRIFLGGGGSAEKSIELDRAFIECAETTKTLVYVPNAQEPERHNSCLAWFRSVMVPLGVAHIEMWNSLRPKASLSEIGGIYIGGGNTGRLLFQMRKSGFLKYLKAASVHGVPIYGGSAGAIVLGADIRTTPEAANCDGRSARGLALLSKLSVACHYDGNGPKLIELSRRLRKPVLGIPETAGVVAESFQLRILGDSVALTDGKKLKMLKPGDSENFAH